MLPSLTGGLRGQPQPTYATWNPLDKSARVTLSGGNLVASVVDGGSAYGGVRAQYGKSRGKWYWSLLIAANDDAVGVVRATHPLTTTVHNDPSGYSYHTNGKKYHNETNPGTNYGSTYTAGDRIGIALDLDSGSIWFSKNGVWQASGDPTAGTNAAFTGLTGPMYPCWSNADFGGGFNDPAVTANFGATQFVYQPPAGFNAGWFKET